MKILHLDIETAPHKAYVWGMWDQNISSNQIEEYGYTLCWAAKWHGVKGVLFNSVHQTDELRMLQGMWELLNEADAVTHYNGKKFDVPTLNREFILNDMPPPSPYHQIDLIQVMKRNFKFPRNGLNDVSQQLGLGKKTKHMGMELWKNCMAGDDKAWGLMERYNKQDVVLLEKLYKRLLPWIKDHPNHALYVDTTRPVCTNCGSPKVQSRGTEHTKTQSYKRFQCTGCGTWLRGRLTVVAKEKKPNILTQSKL